MEETYFRYNFLKTSYFEKIKPYICSYGQIEHFYGREIKICDVVDMKYPLLLFEQKRVCKVAQAHVTAGRLQLSSTLPFERLIRNVQIIPHSLVTSYIMYAISIISLNAFFLSICLCCLG